VTGDLEQRVSRIKNKIAERGLQLNPPASLGEVEFFEARSQVRLPEEYRRFLLEIGDGGGGPPEYGLMKLGQVPKDRGADAGEALEHLHRPFPLTRHWVWEGDEDPKEELRQALNHGRLHLGTDGCGMYWILIVTGPERGQVWLTADVGIQPCAPRRDFLSWYEYWLDGGREWWADFKE
jgi:hypothetical protein